MHRERLELHFNPLIALGQLLEGIRPQTDIFIIVRRGGIKLNVASANLGWEIPE